MGPTRHLKGNEGQCPPILKKEKRNVIFLGENIDENRHTSTTD